MCEELYFKGGESEKINVHWETGGNAGKVWIHVLLNNIQENIPASDVQVSRHKNGLLPEIREEAQKIKTQL